MTTQQGELSTPVPAASDAPDGPGLALGIALAIQKLDTVATIAALPSSGNWLGRVVRVRATPGALWWSDGAVTWTMYGEPYFVDKTARDAAILSPVVGMRCYLTGVKMKMEYDGAHWVKQGVLRPSAAVATGGTVVFNDDGSLTCSFTGAWTLTLTGSNAPLALTDITDVDFDWVSGGAVSITVKMAAAGVVDPASTGYDTYGGGNNQSGTAVTSSLLNSSSWVIDSAVAHIEKHLDMAMMHFNDATKRSYISNFARTVTTLASAENRYSLNHSTRTKTQAWDGMQYAGTGAGTLTLKHRPRV